MLLDNIMENKKKLKPNPDLKLMDQVRQVLRYHHYAYRTEQTYCEWILKYINFHKCEKHPRDMGNKEIESFLSHLATDKVEKVRKIYEQDLAHDKREYRLW